MFLKMLIKDLYKRRMSGRFCVILLLVFLQFGNCWQRELKQQEKNNNCGNIVSDVLLNCNSDADVTFDDVEANGTQITQITQKCCAALVKLNSEQSCLCDGSTMQELTRGLGRDGFWQVVMLSRETQSCGVDFLTDDQQNCSPFINALHAQNQNVCKDNLVDLIDKEGLSFFKEAIDVSGFQQILETQENEFTVFLPTDDTVKVWLLANNWTEAQIFANTSLMQNLVGAHVVSNVTITTDTLPLNSRPDCFHDMRGGKINVMQKGDEATANDAIITNPDLVACNGVLHVVNNFLWDPSQFQLQQNLSYFLEDQLQNFQDSVQGLELDFDTSEELPIVKNTTVAEPQQQEELSNLDLILTPNPNLIPSLSPSPRPRTTSSSSPSPKGTPIMATLTPALTTQGENILSFEPLGELNLDFSAVKSLELSVELPQENYNNNNNNNNNSFKSQQNIVSDQIITPNIDNTNQQNINNNSNYQQIQLQQLQQLLLVSEYENRYLGNNNNNQAADLEIPPGWQLIPMTGNLDLNFTGLIEDQPVPDEILQLLNLRKNISELEQLLSPENEQINNLQYIQIGESFYTLSPQDLNGFNPQLSSNLSTITLPLIEEQQQNVGLQYVQNVQYAQNDGIQNVLNVQNAGVNMYEPSSLMRSFAPQQQSYGLKAQGQANYYSYSIPTASQNLNQNQNQNQLQNYNDSNQQFAYQQQQQYQQVQILQQQQYQNQYQYQNQQQQQQQQQNIDNVNQSHSGDNFQTLPLPFPVLPMPDPLSPVQSSTYGTSSTYGASPIETLPIQTQQQYQQIQQLSSQQQQYQSYLQYFQQQQNIEDQYQSINLRAFPSQFPPISENVLDASEKNLSEIPIFSMPGPTQFLPNADQHLVEIDDDNIITNNQQQINYESTYYGGVVATDLDSEYTQNAQNAQNIQNSPYAQNAQNAQDSLLNLIGADVATMMPIPSNDESPFDVQTKGNMASLGFATPTITLPPIDTYVQNNSNNNALKYDVTLNIDFDGTYTVVPYHDTNPQNKSACSCDMYGNSGGVQTGRPGCWAEEPDQEAFCYVVDPVECENSTMSVRFEGAGWRYCELDEDFWDGYVEQDEGDQKMQGGVASIALGSTPALMEIDENAEQTPEGCECIQSGVFSDGVNEIGCAQHNSNDDAYCYVQQPNSCPFANPSKRYPQKSWRYCDPQDIQSIIAQPLGDEDYLQDDACECTQDGFSGPVDTGVIGCGRYLTLVLASICYVKDPINCATAIPSTVFPGAAWHTC